ncbi:hypothetical protein PR048_003264 [Dryococelus australis]|uniref:Integrase catalytic domain-containing protein n=1 Tax=Dryococelus australis TaxID=614101 RepID=A0ABQ9IN39_9NEOP|nr:hypothetical protein PR048_003264 [Dryococelus australis]
MKTDIRQYVGGCADCQLAKEPRNKLPVRPWENVIVDVYCPLPRSHKGNNCILILIDTFSKFMGPEQLVSDNASYFISKLFKDTCFELGIKHITTSLYYPSPNLVQRVNKNVKLALLSKKTYYGSSNWHWPTMVRIRC